MKSKIISFLALCFIAILSYAQSGEPIPATIPEIQSRSLEELSNCTDLSSFHNLTVITKGRMVTSGRINFPPATISGFTIAGVNGSTTGVNASGRELYIQAGNGTFAGIMIRKSISGSTPTTPADLLDLIAGDSIEVVGIVNSFQGMTQIEPLSVRILVPSASVPNVPNVIDNQKVEGIAPVLVNLSELNGANAVNRITTGEKYEGMFVELRDLTVVNVFPNPPIDVLSGTTRVRITCEDANGNQIQIYDRFRAARLSGWGGRLSVPVVGSKYNSIKGMLTHTKNAPTGVVCGDIDWSTQDQGYQLHPFYPTHYQIGDSPPALSGISISPSVPNTSADVVVSVNAQALNEGISVAGVTLHYSTDTLDLPNFTQIAMSRSGSTFLATIPASNLVDGKFIYLYTTAIDSRETPLKSIFPRVAVSIPGQTLGNQKPYAFLVKNAPLSIRDIQYTPFADGRSLFENRQVTVVGVVTATPDKAGFISLQDDTATSWGGVFVDNTSSNLANIRLGWKLKLVGTVTERTSSGNATFTILTNLVLPAPPIPIAQNVKIKPVVLNSTILGGSYKYAIHEKYEGMLAAIVSGEANSKLFVVDTNSDFTGQFNEYRVGPASASLVYLSSITGSRNLIPGTRVLAGRAATSNNILNSLNFSMVTARTDVSALVARDIVPEIVALDMAMDTLIGIVQHSFGNMKILPRTNEDRIGFERIVLNSLFPIAENIETGIYPNPSTGIFNVKAKGKSSLEILNITGTVILSQNFDSLVNIDLSVFPKGLYLAKIFSQGKATTKRLILE